MIDMLIDFEQGNLSEADTVKLFSELVKTGMAWNLQGFYGRTAMDMIKSGVLDRHGNILMNLEEVY
jgi:hypothetical protein